jgi:hypothetical protein
MKSSSHGIGNRTGYLPYCSAVPEPTEPSRSSRSYCSWSLSFFQRWMTNKKRHLAQPRINKQFYYFVSASTERFWDAGLLCSKDVDCCCLSNVLTCSLQGSAGTRLYAGHDRTSTSRSSRVSVGDCRRETRHLVNGRIWRCLFDDSLSTGYAVHRWIRYTLRWRNGGKLVKGFLEPLCGHLAWSHCLSIWREG